MSKIFIAPGAKGDHWKQQCPKFSFPPGGKGDHWKQQCPKWEEPALKIKKAVGIPQHELRAYPSAEEAIRHSMDGTCYVKNNNFHAYIHRPGLAEYQLMMKGASGTLEEKVVFAFGKGAEDCEGI
jgi:hypothetical protein